MTDSIEGASPILLLEHWKPVLGLEGTHEVSTVGHIRRLDDYSFVKQSLNAYGYPRVWLRSCGKEIHRATHIVVAQAFLGLPPVGHEVDHIDTFKANCWLSNLEYVTHAENMRRAYVNGLMAKGDRLPQTILTDDIVKEIRRLKGKVTAKKLGEAFGVSQWAVHKIFQGRNWKHVA